MQLLPSQRAAPSAHIAEIRTAELHLGPGQRIIAHPRQTMLKSPNSAHKVRSGRQSTNDGAIPERRQSGGSGDTESARAGTATDLGERSPRALPAVPAGRGAGWVGFCVASYDL